MQITFHGAARTTTGSMHLVQIGEERILLDCGLMQGHRKEAFQRNRNLPFEPASISKVLLSHAHIDHSGNLPSLVRGGFTGEIVATPATRDLCDIMLRDSAYLQKRDVEKVNRKRLRQGKRPFEPLYEAEDVEQTMRQFRELPYDQPIEIADRAQATFHDAGHILGSALTTIDLATNGTQKRLLFTGDMGRPDIPILRDPTVVTDVDWLVTECTYGDRRHPPKADVQGRLKGFVEDIVQQRAKLVIPAFSVGRTQNIVYYLRELHEEGRIPPVPVYVDSPLSSKATRVYADHPECYDAEAMEVMFNGDKPFSFEGLTYVTDVEESKELNDADGPMIIISASGMCEGGRILHHLAHTVTDPRHIILIVGYQAQHTLGRRLVEHDESVKIFGDPFVVRARVHTINALSAHADRRELMAYFQKMGPKVQTAFCVHGEDAAVTRMASELREAGAGEVVVPSPGDRAALD